MSGSQNSVLLPPSGVFARRCVMKKAIELLEKKMKECKSDIEMEIKFIESSKENLYEHVVCKEELEGKIKSYQEALRILSEEK